MTFSYMDLNFHMNDYCPSLYDCAMYGIFSDVYYVKDLPDMNNKYVLKI